MNSSKKTGENRPLRRGNHFVPQGYLRSFATSDENSEEQSPSLIYVYDKRPGHNGKARQVGKRSIKKEVAKIHDLYVTKAYDIWADIAGEVVARLVAEDDRLEQGFGYVETQSFPLLRSLEPDRNNAIGISDEERSLLSIFISLSYLRTPSFLDWLTGPFRQAAMEQHQADEAESSLRAMLGSTNPNALVNFIPQMAEKVAQKRWLFCIPANGMSFVTCDTPVHHKLAKGYRRTGVDKPWRHEQEIIMPLRRDLGLICTPGPEVNYAVPVAKFGTRQTKDFRRTFAMNAKRFVYADFFSSEFADMVFRRRHINHAFFENRD